MTNPNKAKIITLVLCMTVLFIFFQNEVKTGFMSVIDLTRNEKPSAISKEPSIKSKKPVSKKPSGEVLDSYNGVKVYSNGNVRDVHGRNITSDGYNLGLKYQCVEFVKRYYYEKFNHRMPDSYGDAKDFFADGLNDGAFNQKRGLIQYKNPSAFKPQSGDILVYGPNEFNAFGHVAIVTAVGDGQISCIAQNLGHGNGSRRDYVLLYEGGRWTIDEADILGWLRK